MLDAYLMTLCIQMEYPWTATSTGMAVPVLAALRIIYMILVGIGKDLEVFNSSWNPQESPGIPCDLHEPL